MNQDGACTKCMEKARNEYATCIAGGGDPAKCLATLQAAVAACMAGPCGGAVEVIVDGQQAARLAQSDAVPDWDGAPVSVFGDDPQATDWNSSEAYADSAGNSSSPTITISESTIWVYHHQTGGGRVTQTALRGSGGTHRWSTPGKKSVPPGTYTHTVSGTIYGSGSIHSGIRYK